MERISIDLLTCLHCQTDDTEAQTGYLRPTDLRSAKPPTLLDAIHCFHPQANAAAFLDAEIPLYPRRISARSVTSESRKRPEHAVENTLGGSGCPKKQVPAASPKSKVNTRVS